MANTKSAKKRVEVNKRNKLRNLHYKTSLKNLIKLFIETLNLTKLKSLNSDQNLINNDLIILKNKINSIMDKSVKTKVLSKRTIARRKSRLFKH